MTRRARSAQSLSQRGLFDPGVLRRLSEEQYWAGLQAIVDDAPSRRGWRSDARSFARFGLLLMSPLAGWVWRGAERDVALLRVAQVLPTAAEVARLRAQRLRLQPAEDRELLTDYCLDYRGRLDYPIVVAPVVERAGRDALRRQRDRRDAYLVPREPGAGRQPPARRRRYGIRLLVQYLAAAWQAAGQLPPPALSDYLAVGRYVLKEIYDPDVRYATIRALNTAPTLPEEFAAPDFLERLRQPVRVPAAALRSRGVR